MIHTTSQSKLICFLDTTGPHNLEALAPIQLCLRLNQLKRHNVNVDKKLKEDSPLSLVA